MKVCLFDIDGTLVSTGGAGKAAMEAALVSEFGVVEVIDGIPFSGRTDRAIGRDLLLRHHVEASPARWQQLVDAYLGHLPAFLAAREGRVLPGIKALLDALKQQRYTAGLLTGNIREGARIKLARYGLWDYFAFGSFGDEHFDRDDVAREAVAALKVYLDALPGPGRLWVIGDTPLDIRCARCIGARVAAVATGWHSMDELAYEKPDLLLEDLSNPEPLLSELRGR